MVYGSEAAPVESIATGDPTLVPFTENCTVPVSVCPPSDTGLTVAWSVVGSLYCAVGAVTVTAVVAWVTVSDAVPLLALYVLSPAKLAPTPVGYVPALIPARLTFESV